MNFPTAELEMVEHFIHSTFAFVRNMGRRSIHFRTWLSEASAFGEVDSPSD